MWKEAPWTRKKEVLSSHRVESSRPSLTTVSLEVLPEIFFHKYGNTGNTDVALLVSPIVHIFIIYV